MGTNKLRKYCENVKEEEQEGNAQSWTAPCALLRVPANRRLIYITFKDRTWTRPEYRLHEVLLKIQLVVPSLECPKIVIFVLVIISNQKDELIPKAVKLLYYSLRFSSIYVKSTFSWLGIVLPFLILNETIISLFTFLD